MTGIRILFTLIFASIAAYTAVTIANHGWNLLPIFFGDMANMAWPGQFNFDFMCFLVLSGVWVAWRHHFSPVGLALAVCAVLGGALFLSAYLLIMSFKVDNKIETLLLGNERASKLS